MAESTAVTNITRLPGSESAEHAEGQADTAYAASIAKIVIPKLDELGMAPEFRGIVGEHISALQVVAAPTQKESALRVEKIPIPGKKKGVWQRQIAVSPFQLGLFQDAILQQAPKASLSSVAKRAVGELVVLGEVQPEDNREALYARSIALGWTFFEHSMDALFNGVHMQRAYGRYVRDYAGLERRPLVNIHELRAGLALELLGDDLIRRGVTDTTESTKKVIDKIREAYPNPAMKNISALAQPAKREKLENTISNLEPVLPEPTIQTGLAQVIRIDKAIG